MKDVSSSSRLPVSFLLFDSLYSSLIDDSVVSLPPFPIVCLFPFPRPQFVYLYILRVHEVRLERNSFLTAICVLWLPQASQVKESSSEICFPSSVESVAGERREREKRKFSPDRLFLLSSSFEPFYLTLFIS